VAPGAVKQDKLWRKMSAAEYAALFPRKPKALRKIAYGLRKLGSVGEGIAVATPRRLGQGNQVFTMNERQLAESCGVSVRTLQRYLWLFESYGILEVKRWRYRQIGTSPNSYRLYFGSVIPPDWRDNPGKYPISPVDRRAKKARATPVEGCGDSVFGIRHYLVEGKIILLSYTSRVESRTLGIAAGPRGVSSLVTCRGLAAPPHN
jgi:hypothetical protein